MIKPIDERHPDYIVLTLECEWPTHQDVLWAEMQRVSDAICRDRLLVEVQQFIG